MSQTYELLIQQWRAAAARTREGQARLNELFDVHIQGGPPPSDADVQHMRELREDESRKLEAAMRYARDAAHGPQTGMGELR